MEDILVTIYCTAFNHEEYIRTCLDGFVMQITNFRFVVLVHDDASTDKTAEIIQEYERKYPELIIGIYQETNQVSKGINIIETEIFPRIQGKYVAVCEGDDYWTDRNKLQQQVDILEHFSEYSAVIHNAIVVGRHGEKLPEKMQKIYRADHDRVLDSSFLKNYCKVGHTATFMYRWSLFSNMSPECRKDYLRLRANGDMKMSAVFLANGKVLQIAKDMSCYRYVDKGTDSWTAQNATRNLCYVTCSQLQNINSFLHQYYGKSFDYSGYFNKRAFESVVWAIKHPSRDNYKIMKMTIKIANYSMLNFLSSLCRKCLDKLCR